MTNLRFIKNVSAYSRSIDNLSFYSFQLSSLIIKKQHYIVHYLQVLLVYNITSKANNDIRLFQR